MLRGHRRPSRRGRHLSIPDLDDLTEMKIRLPIKHHIRLHAAKYVTGKPIGEMVAEALDAYLPSRLEAPP